MLKKLNVFKKTMLKFTKINFNCEGVRPCRLILDRGNSSDRTN